MKIGIITQPLSDNYGGILQNYALQTVLCRHGHEPITLHVLPQRMKRVIWVILTAKYLLTLSAFTHKRRYFRLYPFRDPVMAQFVRNHIATTQIHREYKHIKIDNMGLNALIVGSDQVWRKRYNMTVWRDKFLLFSQNASLKKIAYAASWGSDKCEFSKEEVQECRKLIKQFDAVSVREQSGIQLCHDVLGVNAIEVLDPTLLLNREDYLNLCNNIVPPAEPYLAAFILDQATWKNKLVNEIANKNGLRIVNLGLKKDGISIEQWLAYFAHAHYVVTDSFHGTVFSIINHRPFSVVVNTERGASRFESLLNKFNLEKRIADDDHFEDSSIIDWETVDQRLEQWRQTSLNYLETALNK
jgi:hypothetical protein